MAVALDCVGISCLGDGLGPAADADAKRAAAARAGVLAIQLAEAGITARRFLDRRALLHAMTGMAATGGSTNGVLHLPAIAHEAQVPLSLEELAELGERTPVIASLAPSGRHTASISTERVEPRCFSASSSAADSSTGPPRP
jgi:dihydroxy-acid dehydratase